MPTIEVSEEELSAIQCLRSKKLNKIAEEKFQFKAIATAHRFAKWSNKKGLGLTFSTFVNTFGYQESDVDAMYRAVERILIAAFPQ